MQKPSPARLKLFRADPVGEAAGEPHSVHVLLVEQPPSQHLGLGVTVPESGPGQTDGANLPGNKLDLSVHLDKGDIRLVSLALDVLGMKDDLLCPEHSVLGIVCSQNLF